MAKDVDVERVRRARGRARARRTALDGRTCEVEEHETPSAEDAAAIAAEHGLSPTRPRLRPRRRRADARRCGRAREDAAEDAVVTDPVETVASAVTDTPEETA